MLCTAPGDRDLAPGTQERRPHRGTPVRYARTLCPGSSSFEVIAGRILYTTLAAPLDGYLPCKVVVQPVEWQAMYCCVHRNTRPPDAVPSQHQA